MISITCASCGKGLRIKDELAGKRGKCPNCGQTVQIPAAQPPQPDLVSLDEAAEDSERDPPFPPPRPAAKPAGEGDQSQFPTSAKRKGQSRRKSGGSQGKIIAAVAVGVVALLGLTLWLTGFFGVDEQEAAVATDDSAEEDDSEAADADEDNSASTSDDMASDASDDEDNASINVGDSDTESTPDDEPEGAVGTQQPMTSPPQATVVDTSRLTFTEESDELLDFPGAKALAFSPDGSLLIAAGTTPDDAALPVMMSWEVDAWTKLYETSPDAVYMTLAFAPDGDTLYAASGEDEKIVLIDPRTLESKGELTDDAILIAFAVASDGTLASVSSDDWGIQLWERGRKADAWEGAGAVTTSLAFSRDGSLLASTGERTLIWDVSRGEIVKDLTDQLSSASSFGASFSRTGEELAVSCNDSYTWILGVPDGNLIHQLEASQLNIFAVRYAPDGRTLLTRSMAALDGSDATSAFLAIAEGSDLYLWNVSSGESVYLGNEVSIMDTHSFAFSPDGSTIAATGNDGIRIWVGK